MRIHCLPMPAKPLRTLIVHVVDHREILLFLSSRTHINFNVIPTQNKLSLDVFLHATDMPPYFNHGELKLSIDNVAYSLSELVFFFNLQLQASCIGRKQILLWLPAQCWTRLELPWEQLLPRRFNAYYGFNGIFFTISIAIPGIITFDNVTTIP